MWRCHIIYVNYPHPVARMHSCAASESVSGLYVVACPPLPDERGTCLCLGSWSHSLVCLYTSQGHSCTGDVLGQLHFVHVALVNPHACGTSSV